MAISSFFSPETPSMLPSMTAGLQTRLFTRHAYSCRLPPTTLQPHSTSSQPVLRAITPLAHSRSNREGTLPGQAPTTSTQESHSTSAGSTRQP
jgi:hypothetical protein